MITLCLTLGLISEGYPSSNLLVFNPKLLKSVRDIIRAVQGKGREENKKIEGTGFGYQKNGLLDYAIYYLDRIFVFINI